MTEPRVADLFCYDVMTHTRVHTLTFFSDRRGLLRQLTVRRAAFRSSLRV